MQNISDIQTLAPAVNGIKSPQKSGLENLASANAVAETKQPQQAPQPALSAQQQLNGAILKASLETSIQAGNEPLALLYKTAIEGINEALEPELGENAIQRAHDSGLDVTPEATADRIVSMSTAYFSSYQKIHPELSEEEAALKFSEIIGGGIDQGVAEAREILDGLSVLEGDIATNIDATYDLVQEGLQAFIESYRENNLEEKTEQASSVAP